MQPINIKALIETIRDCENNVQLIDLCFPDLPTDQMKAIKKVYPHQIGDGLFSFIDRVIPENAYPEFQQYFNSLYAAKVYPFWMEVQFQSSDIALRATVAEFGITPETIFTSQKDLDKAQDNLIANKISYHIDWWCQDERYPDHYTGRIIIKHTEMKLTADISHGETVCEMERPDYEFISDIESLKNYDIQHLSIDEWPDMENQIKQKETAASTLWTIYGWYLGRGIDPDKDVLLPVSIASCSSYEKAQNLQYLIEVLVNQWKGPRHTHYSLIP